MSATATKTPVIEAADGATIHPLAGGQISVRLRQEQTGGELAATETVIPAHYPGPPRHVHPAFDELFYVLEGRLVFTVGDEQAAAEPGTIAYVPGDVPHAFANPHDEPCRILVVLTPGGFERYFEAIAQAAAQSPDGLPPVQLAVELMAEHGVVPA
jgi:quercetin dioxygenase-like cupin family protein